MFILDDSAATSDSAPAVNPNAGAADLSEGLPANDPNGEGTSHEEVAKVLKTSGVDIGDEIVDEEEGDDPDKVSAPAAEEEKSEDDADTADDDKEKENKPVPAAKADDTPDADTEDKYSFEIEDANGVTFKIAVGATMEQILAEFEPKNNGQVIDILHRLGKLETQKTADEAQAADDAAKAERSEAASKILEGWGEEAKELQAQKRIPAGEDGDKRIDEVYKYMADENETRMKAGKATLNTFEDALDKLENKEAREAKVEQDKADKDTARKNGSLVGGSSAPASSPQPVYARGSARNVNDAIKKMGLL
jgi:hypothetical protein